MARPVLRQSFIRVENNELNRESSDKGTRFLAETAMLAHGFPLAWSLICLSSIYIHIEDGQPSFPPHQVEIRGRDLSDGAARSVKKIVPSLPSKNSLLSAL